MSQSHEIRLPRSMKVVTLCAMLSASGCGPNAPSVDGDYQSTLTTAQTTCALPSQVFTDKRGTDVDVTVSGETQAQVSLAECETGKVVGIQGGRFSGSCAAGNDATISFVFVPQDGGMAATLTSDEKDWGKDWTGSPPRCATTVHGVLRKVWSP